MNIQWDAENYTSNFSFVPQYGEAVIGLLDLGAGKTVLDLGCGSGALTEKLAQTGARVIGLDASPELLQVARKNHPQLEFVQGDARSFCLKERVDAVFSNAVLHWIGREDQPALLRCVFSALKSGGQFAFEFGGAGNNRLIHSALEKCFAQKGLLYCMPFYFPTIGEYASLLEETGFRVTDMTLFDRMTRLNGDNGLEDWMKLFLKAPFEGIAQKDREEMIHQAAGSLREELFHGGLWYADYVRIRGRAVKD